MIISHPTLLDGYTTPMEVTMGLALDATVTYMHANIWLHRSVGVDIIQKRQCLMVVTIR